MSTFLVGRDGNRDRDKRVYKKSDKSKEAAFTIVINVSSSSTSTAVELELLISITMHSLQFSPS
jgi:hypothetical protein